MKNSLNLGTTLNESDADRNTLINFIFDDPDFKMRVGIKEIEEQVTKETQNRKIKAPLTTEEKIFLSL